MAETLVSLGLSFLLVWHGRDRVWTPTFEGTRAERFERAVRHFERRMGLPPAVVLVSDRARVVRGEERCAWAWREDAWADDVIGFWTSKRCDKWKPEELAMHEQAHRRLAHLEPAFWSMPHEEKERGVRALMVAYSAKERR